MVCCPHLCSPNCNSETLKNCFWFLLAQPLFSVDSILPVLKQEEKWWEVLGLQAGATEVLGTVGLRVHNARCVCSTSCSPGVRGGFKNTIPVPRLHPKGF